MDILFTRTFMIVGFMLVITTITSQINKRFETAAEMWGTIIGTFVLLFAVMIFANSYPLNIFLVAVFAGLIGWEIGPSIEYLGERFKLKKYLKTKGVTVKKGEKIPEDAMKEFGRSFDADQYQREWQDIVFQALFATTCAVFAAAGTVYLTSFDFSFLGSILFVALLILVVMGLLNAFVFRSPLFSLIKAYFGAVIFTLYLFYDFDRLEKMAGDESWASAINIAVNIYLDIINLFLDLLEILGESSN